MSQRKKPLKLMSLEEIEFERLKRLVEEAKSKQEKAES